MVSFQVSSSRTFWIRGVIQVGVSQEEKETGPAEDDNMNNEPKAIIPESNKQSQVDANKEDQNKDKTSETTSTTPAKESLLDPKSIRIHTPLTQS